MFSPPTAKAAHTGRTGQHDPQARRALAALPWRLLRVCKGLQTGHVYTAQTHTSVMPPTAGETRERTGTGLLDRLPLASWHQSAERVAGWTHDTDVCMHLSKQAELAVALPGGGLGSPAGGWASMVNDTLTLPAAPCAAQTLT